MSSKWGPELVPVFLAVAGILTFIICYIIAVKDGHVVPGFPYISDTGARVPESCIFGFLLNVVSILGFLVIYIRYKQVKEYNRQNVCVNGLNIASAFLGTMAIVGLMLVASFQDDNVPIVHFVGASMLFGLGVIYSWLQCAITRRQTSVSEGRRLLVIQYLLSAGATIFLISTLVFGIVAAIEQAHGGGERGHFWVQHWNDTMPGFGAHVASTVSEWALALSFLAFFLTYAKAFHKISIEANVRLRLDTYEWSNDSEETRHLNPAGKDSHIY
ncbi:DNA damage-regulated autophagy modulator protein 2-like [Oscarella lobularis]|uniref:DNA damage-regulated autophagy modulator protein 2-like n=1 Tax=Oscarella lobularis TaxID=121494 RepID=UPI00331347F9